MRITSEPTTSEKVKETALAVAGLAIEKAGEVKEKTVSDIAPVVVEKTAAVREAAAPHVETARDTVVEKTAPQLALAAEKAEAAKALAAEKAEAAKQLAAAKLADAQAQAEQNRKDAAKAAKKANKRADKKADKFASLAEKKKGKLEKKSTRKFGVGPRQDVAFKAAALRGQASAFAEDKGISRDNARDLFNDELLPHVKELIAAATAASASATQSAVSRLPEGAQEQVVRYVPAAAPKKKGGRVLIVLGLGALSGAGYLLYTEQQKKTKTTTTGQVSEVARVDAVAPQEPGMTINNPVTDFARGEDETMIRPLDTTKTAEPAGVEGTAATWTDAETTGHTTTEGLETPPVVETRASRREARGDA